MGPADYAGDEQTGMAHHLVMDRRWAPAADIRATDLVTHDDTHEEGGTGLLPPVQESQQQ